ncbi:MAG: 50S ribosomal protein L22 [Candidatus Saccharibacteria bacterium]|nr:50S ribosomal protein L22 [Candidatus Saccharibacteria bacterium]
MSVKASAKGVRLSPRKVGVVAALVRGRTVADAITILDHTPRRPAKAVKTVIQSAQANADNNHGYKPDSLRISTITVTPGPRYKRFRPAAHGRALPYMHRTSHIFIEVDGDKRERKKPVRQAQGKSAAKRTSTKNSATDAQSKGDK